MLKRFSIWLIKNLIIILIATLIFSSITLDLPDLIKSVFSDIFTYASPESQKKVINQLTEVCSSLNQGHDVVTTNQFSKIGSLCKDYKSGKINDREFFFNVISGAIPTEQLQMSSIGFLDRYNKAINYMNKNKIIYFAVLLVLMIILYLLIIDIRLFLIRLSQISFSIGILIMLPYFAIISYDKFVGIDTTSILGSMFGSGSIFDFKAILSVILLMFLRTYNSLIITIGIIFLVIGVVGKVYSWKLKKQSKTAETKTEKKTEKEKRAKVNEEQTKEEMEEAYKHRDRSTKEILDELEEMHKKKSKKD